MKAPKKPTMLTPYVLVLRKSQRGIDGKIISYQGFVWPEKGEVKCPDWEPTDECGNGLHGLLWANGNWSLMAGYGQNKVAQVVKVYQYVKIGNDKIKFPSGEVIYTGELHDALRIILSDPYYPAKELAG